MSFSVSRPAGSALAPLAIVLAVSSIFVSSSFAQSSQEQTLEQVMVTASRTSQKVGNVIVDHVIIESEEIRQSGQSGLLDLLQRKRGVEVSRNGGAGSSGSVYLRGATAKQVVLLIDGVRSTSATTGEPTWSAIPLSQIDRIEIVYGPMGSIYGADAVGGVIQIFTKKGSGSPRLTASAGTGSFGTDEYQVGISGSTGEDHLVRYAINTSQEESDGFNATHPWVGNSYKPDKDGYTKHSTSGQFSWELAKGQELGFNFLNSRNNAQYDATSVFDSRNISEISSYSVHSKNQLTNNWSSFLQLSKTKDRGDTYSSATSRSWVETEISLVSWQNDIRIGKDLLLVLAEHRQEEVLTSANIDRERTTKSLALAYQMNRDVHIGSASVRYDDNSAYGKRVTGSLGYGYHLSQNLRLNGSVGTSFRAPTFNELYSVGYGNPDNRPEKGKNAEVGIYYDDGKSDFSLAYYRNEVKDLLLNRRCVGGSPTSVCAYNVSDALLTGFTISAGQRFDDVRFFASLDLQDPKDRTENKLLERRSRYHGGFGGEYVREKFKMGANVSFSGSRFANAENTQNLGGYALLNLNTTYSLNKDWELFARWNNVLDKYYEVARGYQTAGSNVFAGIRYGFK